MSDHCPVFCKYKVPDLKEEKRTESGGSNVKTFPSWRKATDKQKSDFSNEVKLSLERITIPVHLLNCRNVHCKDTSHKADIDQLMCAVLGTIEETANKNMATSTKQQRKPKIPEWKEDIEPFRENAHFWHAIWISAGRPINCQLHDIMKKTRNRYHLIIRKKKRLIERGKCDEMLTSCLKNDTSIFDAIRKKRKCGHTVPSTIDGHSKDIPGYLATKYEKLYNAVDDEKNLVDLEDFLECSINQQNIKFVEKINSGVLKLSARKLKPGKTDPVLNVTSDFLVHAPDIVFQLLALCLKSYLIHAHVSDFLLISMLIPIIKNKLGDITSSNNYRSIAISSLIMKLFDIVIITLFKENLFFDDLQFGYQSEVSTSMCTWLATETISYFTRNGSEVFTCLMDMSKAFDTVQHSCLFKKLLDQGMPPIIVRFILVMYKNQQENVKWNNEFSRFFNIKNGVKQGAVLSAILYCVYTNRLFEELRRLKIGCHIGQNYVGIIGYAHDLFLLSPSLDGLQEMLRVCERYAGNHNLQFSADTNPQKSKTKCLAFLQKERELRGMKLCNNTLPWVGTGKHLGMRIDNIKDIFNRDIMEKRARYIQGNNQLMQEFSFASCMTKIFINKVYNGHHYGSVLWDLYGKQANMVYNTWNTSIRRMLRIDRKSHRYLIEPLSGTQHLKRRLLKGFATFTEKLSTSPKEAVRNVYEMVKHDCRSITGSNIRNIGLECAINPLRPLSNVDIEKKDFIRTPRDAIWKVPLIEELIEMRDGIKDNAEWTKQEIDYTIEYLCTA